MAERKLEVKLKRRKFVQKLVLDADPLNLNVTQRTSAFGTIWAKLKLRSIGKPWSIPNEYISAEIGRYLRLPVPPYAVCTCDDDEETQVFASLWFNYDDRQPLPLRPDRCVEQLPRLTAGVIVFDTFICNADRHSSNIEVDDDVKPRSLRIFDHDVALFGAAHGGGISRLQKLSERLGITDSTITDGFGHCFIDAIGSNEHFGYWVNKIALIPTPWIVDLCKDAQKYGLSKEESIAVSTFLCERKMQLHRILNCHRKKFTNISTWRSL